MPLYRAPKPRTKDLEPTGRRASRRAPFNAEAKKELLRRLTAGGYACEVCHRKGLDLDRHHVFGRAGTGARLGFPWCDMPELSAGLCRECHEEVTVNPGGPVDSQLKRDAAYRFWHRGQREGWIQTDWSSAHDDSLAWTHEGTMILIRMLVAEAEQRGGREVVLGDG